MTTKIPDPLAPNHVLNPLFDKPKKGSFAPRIHYSNEEKARQITTYHHHVLSECRVRMLFVAWVIGKNYVPTVLPYRPRELYGAEPMTRLACLQPHIYSPALRSIPWLCVGSRPRLKSNAPLQAMQVAKLIDSGQFCLNSSFMLRCSKPCPTLTGCGIASCHTGHKQSET